MNRQNNKTERKKTISDTLFTAFMLFTATAVSFCFFHLGNKNSANITVIYTLALILTALKTSGYVYGIVASLFCVIAVNFLFSYPFFKFNFSLDGYPVTFIGMLAITLITSATTTSLKQHQKAAAEREKALAEADKEKLRANLLRAVSHDLRTPLTSIIGSSSSYLENGSDMTEYERTELVSNIKEDSEWLLNMVENLLDNGGYQLLLLIRSVDVFGTENSLESRPSSIRRVNVIILTYLIQTAPFKPFAERPFNHILITARNFIEIFIQFGYTKLVDTINYVYFIIIKKQSAIIKAII